MLRFTRKRLELSFSIIDWATAIINNLRSEIDVEIQLKISSLEATYLPNPSPEAMTLEPPPKTHSETDTLTHQTLSKDLLYSNLLTQKIHANTLLKHATDFISKVYKNCFYWQEYLNNNLIKGKHHDRLLIENKKYLEFVKEKCLGLVTKLVKDDGYPIGGFVVMDRFSCHVYEDKEDAVDSVFGLLKGIGGGLPRYSREILRVGKEVGVGKAAGAGVNYNQVRDSGSAFGVFRGGGQGIVGRKKGKGQGLVQSGGGTFGGGAGTLGSFGGGGGIFGGGG
jgi:hypothetical protein